MKQINIYLRDASIEAHKKLKDFGMNIQDICRKAMIKKCEELGI